MTLKGAVASFTSNERVNFLLTNRIPRRILTLFLGWFSKIERPWVSNPSIAMWRFFSDLDLSEARKTDFHSMHECFTRELKPGARPIDGDPRIITSPCDAIVGACGAVDGELAIQAKGFPYSLSDLLLDPQSVSRYENGTFVTLRLTSSMYHRFHAPYDCRVREVRYISGDTWNVNPIALQRIERLFCKNERAVIPCELPGSDIVVTLVPVAAILVASIRLHFVNVLLHLRYRGANTISCNVPLTKGQEMGWFQHGSTIIVFAPPGVKLHASVVSGIRINVGQPLLTLASGMHESKGKAHPCRREIH